MEIANKTISPGDRKFMQALTDAQFDLYAYIRSLLGKSQDVDDILQDTNLALLQKQDAFEPSHPFLPWAKAFAKNQVMAYRKRQKRGNMVFDEETFALLVEDLSIRDFSAKKALEKVEGCIDLLDPKQKELVDCRFRNGNPLESIAQRRNCSVNAVSILLCRIRRALLNCLQGKNEEAAP